MRKARALQKARGVHLVPVVFLELVPMVPWKVYFPMMVPMNPMMVPEKLEMNMVPMMLQVYLPMLPFRIQLEKGDTTNLTDWFF